MSARMHRMLGVSSGAGTVYSGRRGLGGMVSVGGGAVKKRKKTYVVIRVWLPFLPLAPGWGSLVCGPLALRRAYGEPVVA